MKLYYVNDTASNEGDNEVHEDGCYWLKIATYKTYLGIYNSCREAVDKAKEKYRRANGCKHCSFPCHTT